MGYGQRHQSWIPQCLDLTLLPNMPRRRVCLRNEPPGMPRLLPGADRLMGLAGIVGYSSWSRVMAVELTLCIFPLLHFKRAAGKMLLWVPKNLFAECI